MLSIEYVEKRLIVDDRQLAAKEIRPNRDVARINLHLGGDADARSKKRTIRRESGGTRSASINFPYVRTLGFPRPHLDIYLERSSFLALDQSSRRSWPNRDKVSGDAPGRRLELFWTVIPHFRVMPVDGLHLSVGATLYSALNFERLPSGARGLRP